MKLRTLAITIGALLLSLSLSAQTAAEIEMAKSIARSKGYTDSQINEMISKQQGGGTSSNAQVVPEVSRTVTTNEVAAAVENVPEGSADVKVDDKKSGIYGHDIFKSPDLNFVPSYNMPTPADYKLAAGDEIVIDIWGAVYMNISQTISPEGSITIPDLGPLYLTGQTIAQAEKLLKNQLSRIYSGIGGDNPTTFLRLSLGRIRSFTVNVVGDVERPGTYTLPSLSTVFSALYLSGGPTDIGSVRDVRIYRNNKLYKTFDIYKFVVDGDFSANIRLEDNDLIKVSPYTNLVTIEGKIKRPMIYEIKDNETIATVLGYAGGFLSDANDQKVHVVRIKGERTESFDVVRKDFASFKLQDGDKVSVASNIVDNKNSVFIEGSVWHQGTYAISDTLQTLQQLIAAAGGVKDDVYEDRGYIQRFNEKRDTIALHFSVKNVLNGTEEVMLMPDDSIRIFAQHELEKRTLVYTYGELNAPNIFVYRPGITLGDVILMSGGFTVGAARSNIDVARRNVNDGEMESSDTISTVYNFNLLENPQDVDFKLAPYDMVFVRVAPNYKKQQTVTVAGEVNFPGTYVVEKNVVRISDVIKRAGGVNRDAYVQGATIQRRLTDAEYQRALTARKMALKQAGVDSTMIDEVNRDERYNVGIDLQAALDNPGSYADVVLQEGDIINIPKMNNTVKISGGVLYTNVVTYDPSLKPKDYINMAGGFTKQSIKKSTYIVYMNGKVSRKGTSAFKVEPGCEIIVPVKDVEQMKRVSAAEVMSIASSTASVAAMVVSLINSLK